MLRIAIYVSDHGYGHAARMSALATEFSRFGIYTVVRSSKPDFLFVGQDASYYRKQDCSIDVGVKHGTDLATDLDATLAALIGLMSSRNDIVEREVSFLRGEGIDLVVADIPFLISEACGYAGIPVIAVSNFDWVFIYQRLFAGDPQIRPVLNAIFGLYRRVDAALLLPFGSSSSMAALPRVRKTGLLARYKTEYNDMRKDMDIDPGDDILACTFGGEGEMPVSLDKLCASFRGTVISRGECSADNHRRVAREYDWLDITHASRIILTKPGYSTFAEATQFGKHIIYCPRKGYPEEDVLIDGLASYPAKTRLESLNMSKREWKEALLSVGPSGKAPSKYANRSSLVAADVLGEYFRITGKAGQLSSVFDIGSNNLNYVLWDAGENVPVHTAQYTTGLGRVTSGAKHPGVISAEARRRFQSCLRQLLAWEEKLTPARHFMSAALARQSTNFDVIARIVRKETQQPVKVLSEAAESRYAWLAAASMPEAGDKPLVIDIGGLSMEFVWGMGKHDHRSVPYGLLSWLEGIDEGRIIGTLTELAQSVLLEKRRIVCTGLTGAYLAREAKNKGDIALQDTHGWVVSIEELCDILSRYDRDDGTAKADIPRVLKASSALLTLILDKLGAVDFVVCYYGIALGCLISKSSVPQGKSR